jgi:hypothetical protein
MVGRISGAVSDEEVLEALLGEGETSLLPLVPRECITEIESEPAHAAQRAWEAQRTRWRQEAEARCEARFAHRTGAAGSPIEAPRVADLQTLGLEALDAWLRDIARKLARRDLELGQVAERFWKADGWRRLGYATEQQYASERLGLSLSSIKDKRWLARRLRALPDVQRALESGRIGSEAARLVTRVAAPDTSEAWIARAHQRTLKHLREEVRIAELVTRLTDAPCLPPHEEVVREVHQLQAMVVSGAAFAPDVAPPSQANGQMSAAEMQRALGTLLHAFDSTRHSSITTRHLGRITLRLRVRPDTYWQYRSREHLHRQHGPPGPFLRFLCFSIIETWRHTLRTGVAYEHIYARDRFQCASPVCSSRNVTPHHLQFRSRGGDDSDDNILSLCAWCHLEGVHGGRLRASPPAGDVHWQIGRHGQMVVQGRERQTH